MKNRLERIVVDGIIGLAIIGTILLTKYITETYSQNGIATHYSGNPK